MTKPAAIAGTRLTIERLGARGEGVAATSAGPVFVPYALPGDEILAHVDGERGELIEVLKPSPDRIAPFCKHYGQCGGCAVQALAKPTYENWKRDLVVTALRNANVQADVAPLCDAHGAGRRRAAFHARVNRDALGRHSVTTGFMRARSHEIVAIDACPVFDPALALAPEAAQQIARVMSGLDKPLDIWLTALDNGLDCDLHGAGPIPEDLRAALVRLAQRLDLTRLSLHGEVLIRQRPPQVTMGKAIVELPPGAFLQATRAGEETLATLVTQAAGKADAIADLFAGVGTFTHRLVQTARVHAVESSRPAMEALLRAARATPGAQPVNGEVRDLFRRPLDVQELNRFEAVIFDPPRAGAEAQSRQIAASTVNKVIAVSCNPQTFARDAAILIEGGYRFETVTPVDQFRHSPHVELVGVFNKPRKAAVRRRLLG